MTRDELIKYLSDNFEADEEITFVYHDYGEDIRSTKCFVDTHNRELINGHHEWLDYVKDENGNLVKTWIKLTSEQVRDINLRRCWKYNNWMTKDNKWMTAAEVQKRMRWVTDSITNDNKKCLFIS
jgi:hypothetical protein